MELTRAQLKSEQQLAWAIEQLLVDNPDCLHWFSCNTLEQLKDHSRATLKMRSVVAESMGYATAKAVEADQI